MNIGKIITIFGGVFLIVYAIIQICNFYNINFTNIYVYIGFYLFLFITTLLVPKPLTNNDLENNNTNLKKDVNDINTIDDLIIKLKLIENMINNILLNNENLHQLNEANNNLDLIKKKLMEFDITKEISLINEINKNINNLYNLLINKNETEIDQYISKINNELLKLKELLLQPIQVKQFENQNTENKLQVNSPEIQTNEINSEQQKE
jgi:hypothetical protein